MRYRQFLGIQKEDQNIAEEQAKLKQSFAAGTDIVSPDNLKTIAAAKDAGTPADKCVEAFLAAHNDVAASAASLYIHAPTDGFRRVGQNFIYMLSQDVFEPGS